MGLLLTYMGKGDPYKFQKVDLNYIFSTLIVYFILKFVNPYYSTVTDFARFRGLSTL